MNFFQDQSLARSATRKLIVLYALAVILTGILITLGLAFFVNYYLKLETDLASAQGFWGLILQRPLLPLMLFSAIIFLVVMASFVKMVRLKKGGEYVAGLAGATPVSKNNNDPLIRRYVNVVEEMSIASGTPIPRIYLMKNETAINAFVAGQDINDCVIAVSRGALEKLTRDELQGVIAHEFSHIFNGDMKLNMKLIGYLAGLLFLSNMGSFLIRMDNTGYSSRRRSSYFTIIGLIFWIIGGGGYLMAAFIKSLISKQREFLADASSVQFTRNPDGIGGALKKLFVIEGHGFLEAKKAQEVSHLFFSSALDSWFATHPPLKERIKRVYPRMKWSRFVKQEAKELSKNLSNQSDLINEENKKDEVNETHELVSSFNQTRSSNELKSKFETAGQTKPESLKLAHVILNSIPNSVREELKTSEGAKKYLYSFFEHEGINSLAQYDKQVRFPIMEIALSTLKDEPSEEKKDIVKKIKSFITEDQKVTSTEFILFQLVKLSLFPQKKFFDQRLSKKQFNQFAVQIENLTKHVSCTAKIKLSIKDLSLAFKYLSRATPQEKNLLLTKVVSIITQDDKITSEEYEFARLVCLSLGVPMPL